MAAGVIGSVLGAVGMLGLRLMVIRRVQGSRFLDLTVRDGVFWLFAVALFGLSVLFAIGAGLKFVEALLVAPAIHAVLAELYKLRNAEEDAIFGRQAESSWLGRLARLLQ